MLKSMELAIRLSEIRRERERLGGLETPSDEELASITALANEHRAKSIQYEDALKQEGEEAETRTDDFPTTAVDAEQREREELRSKASVAGFLQAALRGRGVSGAEAELAEAAKVSDGAIPLELWDTREVVERRAREFQSRRHGQGDVETRAVSPAPDTVGVNLDTIRPAVFAQSIAPRLGIEMPRVESGTFASGTITTSLSAAPKGKGDEAPETAAEITVQTAGPKRVSARLGVSIEDVAAVGQSSFEPMLRDNLGLVLSDALDWQAINGDGAGDNLNGLLNQLANPDAPGAVATFDAYAAAHAGGIDGLWAATLRDVSILCGPATMRHSASVFQAAPNYRGEVSAASYAIMHTGGWWTNKRMPAAAEATNIQQAILYRRGRTEMAGGMGMGLRTAVCPHWGEVGIDDIYSGSGRGQRFFTLHVLLGDVIVVQADAYAKTAYKIAA